MPEGITAYIGVGCNLGDCTKNLRDAMRVLGRTEGIKVRRVAPLYRTAPVGMSNQPEFLNTVAEVTTTFAPRDLLNSLLQVEKELGRVRKERWGPRVIDLDLLLYGDAHIVEPGLEVPHPRLGDRAFVVVPLAALAPELILSGGVTAAALAEELRKAQKVVEVTGTGWVD
ncbi:MAG: 2-amino-4-hydroxy-6-hydroxymethyldihydropteridine diphosphokinase [Bacillota bacterium]